MEDKQKIFEKQIADAIIDRPKGFKIGRRQFYLYPVTLGKAYLTQRVLSLLSIDTDNMKLQPFLEALRVVSEHREDVALLLAYYSLHTKKELLSYFVVTARKNFFAKELDDSDMASLLVFAMTWDNTSAIMHYFKIDKEQERLSKTLKAKDTRNTFSFGAKTIYGSIIDAACERYHWTFDYVVWEISYTNLRLMLADHTTSVYLSESEAKKAHVTDTRNMVDGNSKDAIMQAIKGQNWQ